MALKKCIKCVLPETHETITFDAEGVCNICLGQERKIGIDWGAKKKELDGLVERYRGKYQYDCIVPFSGGKDSTFTLLYLVREYGLRVLVVQFDHGFLRQNTLENNRRTLETLGCDFLSFRPNWHVVKTLMKEALIRKGDFCWHCHTGIFSYPMQIAVEKKVPLLVWGETSSEYTAYFSWDDEEEVDEKRFNRFINLGLTAEDMEEILEPPDPRCLDPFRFPDAEALRDLGVRSVCLGSYIPWDTKKQVEEIERELGWRGIFVEGVSHRWQYDKTECFMQGARDLLKYKKRGYARNTHLASLEIRRGDMTRKGGLRYAKMDGRSGPAYARLQDMVGLSEEEIDDILEPMKVEPWKGQ